MASVEFSDDLSSITGNSESGTSCTTSVTQSSTNSTLSQGSSSASSEHHRGAVAYAAVPETILECDSIMDKSSALSCAPAAPSDTSDDSDSNMSDSPDEEKVMKDNLKMLTAQRKAAELRALELEAKRKLKTHQRSNVSSSSHGSKDRSRTRIYPDFLGEAQRFDLSTPPVNESFGTSLLDLTPDAFIDECFGAHISGAPASGSDFIVASPIIVAPRVVT
jgi:hypothetical protein